jgi:hypothetical protein
MWQVLSEITALKENLRKNEKSPKNGVGSILEILLKHFCVKRLAACRNVKRN